MPDNRKRTRRPYAAQTTVPISQTKTEIEELLVDYYGAGGFFYGVEGNYWTLGFAMDNRRVKLALGAPLLEDYAITEGGVKRNAAGQQKAWEQACRSRWRALLGIIKFKLEAVERVISGVIILAAFMGAALAA